MKEMLFFGDFPPQVIKSFPICLLSLFISTQFRRNNMKGKERSRDESLSPVDSLLEVLFRNRKVLSLL
jgi:hypothetical protein